MYEYRKTQFEIAINVPKEEVNGIILQFLNGYGFQPQQYATGFNVTNVSNGSYSSGYAANTNAFVVEKERKKNKFAVMGFVLSFIGLGLTLVNYDYVAPVVMIGIVFALWGMQSRRKELAKLAGIIGAISVFNLVVDIIMALLL